jgi:hypothetical protein
VTTPIQSIIAQELTRPRDELVEGIYARLARLPKAERSEAVRSLIRALVDVSQRPTHTESLIFLPQERER